MDSQRVLELFRSTGAMLEGHFELSSGLHSERYFQCALLLEDPVRAESLARSLAEKIRAKDSARFDVVVGPGGVQLAPPLGVHVRDPMSSPESTLPLAACT